MIRRRGFILIETVIIVFLSGVIALSISSLVYNNNKNMSVMKAYIKVNEVANNEAYRARVGLEQENYQGITVTRTNYVVSDAMGISGLELEYVDIFVKHEKYDNAKTLTIVRRY